MVDAPDSIGLDVAEKKPRHPSPAAPEIEDGAAGAEIASEPLVDPREQPVHEKAVLEGAIAREAVRLKLNSFFRHPRQHLAQVRAALHTFGVKPQPEIIRDLAEQLGMRHFRRRPIAKESLEL